MSDAPGLLGSYARAITGMVPMPLPGRSSSPELAGDARELDEFDVDGAHLAAYNRVCGFRLTDTLPPTYLHVPAFAMALSLMTARSFPFGVLGLVHIENRIEQRRPIVVTERPSLRVHAENLRDHEKGRAVDLVAEATVDGEVVWRDVSTYLRRGGGDGDGDGKRAKQRSSPPRPTAQWRVPGDIGRRYADVSGDRNPIHLHPLSAKLFGMPGAIAHGMWVKARCLAALEGLLPPSHTSEVSFKAPLVIPAKVAFADWPEGDDRAFAVHDARKGRPHLTGRVTAS